MLKAIDTPNAPRPFSNYAQGIAVAPGARLLFVSGQVGATVGGDIPDDARRQHELAWENVLAILAAEGLDHRHVVDAHVYITDRDHVGLYREVAGPDAEGTQACGYTSDCVRPGRPAARRGGWGCGSGPGHMSRSR